MLEGSVASTGVSDVPANHRAAEQQATLSPPELPPVAGAQPQPNEMATLLRLLEILIGRSPVHDGPVVEDLNLTAFHPEVMTMCGVGEEVVQDLDRLCTRVVEHLAGLLVAAPYHPRIEADL